MAELQSNFYGLGAHHEPAASTAAAARELGHSGAGGVAVLCSREVAHLYDLCVFVDDATLFAVFSRCEPSVRLERPYTHAVMSLTVRHERGSLATALTCLANAGVQLTYVECRPLAGKPWEMQFVIDAEGDPRGLPLTTAITRLRSGCVDLRVLGGWCLQPPGIAAALPSVGGGRGPGI